MCIRIKWKGRHDTLRMKPLGLTLRSGFLQAGSLFYQQNLHRQRLQIWRGSANDHLSITLLRDGRDLQGGKSGNGASP